jgi:transcriptional regulator with XRE-family HTH domain
VGHARRRPKRLAEKLKQIREHFGLSQAELTRKLGLDISYMNLSKFELDKNEPDLFVLMAYARFAGVSLIQLADDELDLML